MKVIAKDVDVLGHMKIDFLHYKILMKRKVVQITITEACNLNCIYCYEKNKDFRKMEIPLAKSIIKESFFTIRFK